MDVIVHIFIFASNFEQKWSWQTGNECDWRDKLWDGIFSFTKYQWTILFSFLYEANWIEDRLNLEPKMYI